jgi:hypothetical protein
MKRERYVSIPTQPVLNRSMYTTAIPLSFRHADCCQKYKIYLFEMILLCCKEINPNKPKNRMKASAKNGKPKLQLKGRIFMQNVTETISLQKPGMR